MAMSTTEKMNDNIGHGNSPSAYIAVNPLDNSNDICNTSNRLHSSHNSTISNESDLSLFLDKELDANAKTIDIDELPAFEIRLISPLGRIPSPIDSENMDTPTRTPQSIQERLTPCSRRNNPEFVALQDINAQISPPSDDGDELESSLSRTSSLETIFEGVFLNTPPRQRLNLQNNRINRSRTNPLEKVALSRLTVGKENQMPLSKSEMQPPTNPSINYGCITDSCAVHENNNFS